MNCDVYDIILIDKLNDTPLIYIKNHFFPKKLQPATYQNLAKLTKLVR